MHHFAGRLIVVKYGGSVLARAPFDQSAQDPVLADCAALVRGGARLVIVHGGGPQIDLLLTRLALGRRRVAGLRVTDGPTLEIVEAVLCGTVNKALVRAAARLGMRAAGISGEDGGVLRARKAPGEHDLGFVGEVERVEPELLEALLAAGYVPVVAPLALGSDGPAVYNVNADTSAGAIAGALRADAYVAVTDVERLRSQADDPGTGLPRASATQVRALISSGAIAGGMIPKVEAALVALAAGARRAFIAGAGPAPISHALDGGGTEIIVD